MTGQNCSQFDNEQQWCVESKTFKTSISFSGWWPYAPTESHRYLPHSDQRGGHEGCRGCRWIPDAAARLLQQSEHLSNPTASLYSKLPHIEHAVKSCEGPPVSVYLESCIYIKLLLKPWQHSNIRIKLASKLASVPLRMLQDTHDFISALWLDMLPFKHSISNLEKKNFTNILLLQPKRAIKEKVVL